MSLTPAPLLSFNAPLTCAVAFEAAKFTFVACPSAAKSFFGNGARSWRVSKAPAEASTAQTPSSCRTPAQLRLSAASVIAFACAVIELALRNPDGFRFPRRRRIDGGFGRRYR